MVGGGGGAGKMSDRFSCVVFTALTYDTKLWRTWCVVDAAISKLS